MAENYDHFYYKFNFIFLKPAKYIYSGEISYNEYLANEDYHTKRINLRDHVRMFKIFYCYTDFYFPVIKMTLFVNKEICMDLVENIDEGYFSLQLKKFVNDLNQSQDEVVLDDWCLHRINLVPINFDKRAYEEIDEMSETKTNDGFNQSYNIKIDLELFSKDHLELLKTPINTVLNDISLKDTLLYCFKEYTKEKQLLMSPVENTAEIEQIIFAYKNLPKSIEYLQDTYGIYKYGLRLFFDYHRHYCLSNNLIENDIVKEDDELEYNLVYINVVDIDKVDKNLLGSYEDTENERYVIKALNLNLMEFSDQINKEITGERIKSIQSTVNEYDRMNELENKTSVYNSKSQDNNINSQEDNEKKKYYYNQYSNEFTESTMLAESAKMNLRVILQLECIDINILTPNKNYYINFNNKDLKEFNGSYQLNSAVIDIVGNSSKSRYVNITAVFDRMTKDLLSLS